MKIYKCAICGKEKSGKWPLVGWFHHAKDPEAQVPYCSKECSFEAMSFLYTTDNDPFLAAKLAKETPKEKQ